MENEAHPKKHRTQDAPTQNSLYRKTAALSGANSRLAPHPKSRISSPPYSCFRRFNEAEIIREYNFFSWAHSQASLAGTNRAAAVL